MTFELRIFEGECSRGRHAWNHLRFAVIDLNKSKSYPENFVSMLPMRIVADGKLPSTFVKLFGNKSLKIARGLLAESLKKEQGAEIKAEIERRLSLLEPNPVIHNKCRVCKKIFPTRKALKQRICPKCLKRYGSQE